MTAPRKRLGLKKAHSKEGKQDRCLDNFRTMLLKSYSATILSKASRPLAVSIINDNTQLLLLTCVLQMQTKLCYNNGDSLGNQWFSCPLSMEVILIPKDG